MPVGHLVETLLLSFCHVIAAVIGVPLQCGAGSGGGVSGSSVVGKAAEDEDERGRGGEGAFVVGGRRDERKKVLRQTSAVGR